MNQEQILIRSDSSFGLTTLTLNRPLAFNSLSEELIKSIQFELDELMTNESVLSIFIVLLLLHGFTFFPRNDTSLDLQP